MINVCSINLKIIKFSLLIQKEKHENLFYFPARKKITSPPTTFLYIKIKWKSLPDTQSAIWRPVVDNHALCLSAVQINHVVPSNVQLVSEFWHPYWPPVVLSWGYLIKNFQDNLEKFKEKVTCVTFSDNMNSVFIFLCGKVSRCIFNFVLVNYLNGVSMSLWNVRFNVYRKL